MSYILPEQISKYIDQFTGRAWLLPRILNCYENSIERMFLITGDPGTGKSMVAAWLAGSGPLPAGVWEFHDLAQPFQASMPWIGRLSYVSNQENSPFDQWQPATQWDESANQQGIERWDEMLRQRAGLDDTRFVLLAGSDAHGSFNFSEGWWLDWNGLRADDNCLGKVITLLYLPARDPAGSHIAPSEAEIVEAIRTGSCVVTDGPVLNAVLRCNGAQAALGQILTADGGDFEVQVQAVSTAEFGPVIEIELHYYFRGMDRTASVSLPFVVGQTRVIASGLPAGPGYVRLATKTQNGHENYRCFTNPIWIRPTSTSQHTLALHCAEKNL